MTIALASTELKDSSHEENCFIRRAYGRIARRALAASGAGDRASSPDSLFCRLRSSSRPVCNMGGYQSGCARDWRCCHALVFEATWELNRTANVVVAMSESELLK